MVNKVEWLINHSQVETATRTASSMSPTHIPQRKPNSVLLLSVPLCAPGDLHMFSSALPSVIMCPHRRGRQISSWYHTVVEEAHSLKRLSEIIMIVIIKLECCSSHWSSSWCVAVFTRKHLVIYFDYNRDMRTDSSHFQEISHPVAELHNENEARGTNLYADVVQSTLTWLIRCLWPLMRLRNLSCICGTLWSLSFRPRR